jgi:hypothetical protein
MPDLVGKVATSAKLELANLGIPYETIEEVSQYADKGLVLRTEPPAGDELTGSVVVVVSAGPPYVKPKVTPTVEPIWQPDGYTKFDKDIAYKFTTDDYGGDPCGYSRCSFWVIEVVSRYGCPGGVYAKLNILESGKVVDWSNELLAGLSIGQTGEMVFTAYGLGSGSYSGEIVDFSCYE